MSALDKKLLRDLLRLWAQGFAIAMVIAAGVATLILGVGAQSSLDETRQAYYERYRFADLFVSLKRAPDVMIDRIREIPGVAAAESRVVKAVLLDIEGMAQPATALTMSLPDHRDALLNRLYLRTGRTPEPGNPGEVVVNEAFALAHGFRSGSRFSALLNGRKRQLTIVGIALSPEFIYALGPGDLIPDDRRFGLLWMSHSALASVFDLEGAFNNVTLKLLRGASEADVIQQVDGLLERYGGTGAYGRKDQQSHAFIDAELEQLKAMSRVIPPIFLLVSAFLINITLSRLIALEREQIGLLKAVGYGKLQIAMHYIKLTLVIALVGVAVGAVAGTWLGQGLTRLYADFFKFPFLLFDRDIGIYTIAAAISFLAAGAGGARAVISVMNLPPAVAMSPPVPVLYGQSWMKSLSPLLQHLSHLSAMAIRHSLRWPLRSAFTTLGIALSGAVLITALFATDSVETMIDTIFVQTERQDATLGFTDERSPDALQAVGQLPGVMDMEPFRTVPVRIRNGPRHRKLAILGKTADPDLSRVLNLEHEPVKLPEEGLLLSERVATLLNARRGDLLEVELLEGKRGTRWVRVSDVIQSYLGLQVYMDIDALNELLDEGPRLSGAHILFDSARSTELFDQVKNTPAVASISLQGASLAKFRETLAKNIDIMTTVYVVLSVIIAFGVVYNSARIQLSERAREFASLRVLGFTRGEVSRVLLTELGMLLIPAIPLGWLIGYGFAWLTIRGFESDLYRVPFTVETRTFAIASLVVIAAASISGLIVRRRIDRLDMIRALKTRE